MSVFALFLWAIAFGVVALAAWGVGYDMGRRESEKWLRTPPPSTLDYRNVKSLENYRALTRNGRATHGNV